jgi:hypothetical protein
MTAPTLVPPDLPNSVIAMAPVEETPPDHEVRRMAGTKMYLA